MKKNGKIFTKKIEKSFQYKFINIWSLCLCVVYYCAYDGSRFPIFKRKLYLRVKSMSIVISFPISIFPFLNLEKAENFKSFGALTTLHRPNAPSGKCENARNSPIFRIQSCNFASIQFSCDQCHFKGGEGQGETIVCVSQLAFVF